MDRYAVVGNPIAHSKSPDIHALFAEQTQQDLRYDKMLVELGAFETDVASFFALGGKGLNVTVPFKENAYRFADELTQRAQLAGAVNTLIKQQDGRVLGDTTDGAGLVQDLLRQSWIIAQKRVLVLGAGGAVRGVLQPLLEQKPKEVVVANRTLSKAQDLAQTFADFGEISASSFDELTGWSYDLVINGTSASLSGALPDLPVGLFAQGACAYDMVYGDKPTAFMTWAQEQGAEAVSDGLGMLVGQAAESFYLWRGVRPNIRTVISALRFKAC